MTSLNGEGQEEEGVVASYHPTAGVSLTMKSQLAMPLQQIIHQGLAPSASILMVLLYVRLITGLPHLFLKVDGSVSVTETMNKVTHCMTGKGMSLVRSVASVYLGVFTVGDY
jgi:hypothetical protein